MALRPEDEALLARLDDEALYERLLHAHGGRELSPHKRASGLVHALRALPGAEKAFAMANDPDPEKRRLDALTTLMMPSSFAGYPPALLHHLALHFSRVAVAARDKSLVWSRTAHEAALAAFFALAAHEGYLTSFVSRALGEGASARDVDRLASSLPLEPLAALGAEALEGARRLGTETRAALDVLTRVPGAAARSGAPAPFVAKVVARAEALRATAVDAALEPIAQALDDATIANELTSRGIDVLVQVVPVWEATGRDEAVERFFVERAEPVCWEIQRRKEWERFASLFGSPEDVSRGVSQKATFRLVESLFLRVKADRSKVAYAAACAQFFVFYTNVVATLDRQIAVGERALDVCPSHRNGRAVLASFLCQKAVRLSEGLVPQRSALDDAWALVTRAETLFPTSREVKETRELVERRRSGGFPRLP